MLSFRSLSLCLPLLFAVGCNGKTTEDCQSIAAQSLQVCLQDVNAAQRACYEADGQHCATADASVSSALDQLQADLEGTCADGEIGQLSTQHLVERLRTSCLSEAQSLAWRAFGGLQGAALEDASDTEQTCMYLAHDKGSEVMDNSLQAINTCLADEDCDPASVDRQSFVNSATNELNLTCPALAETIAVGGSLFLDRVEHQVDCITATAHANTDGLALECGPSYAQFEADREEWTQVIVDGDKWGTMCGDGSEYAFYIRLAPEGAPLDNVLIGLQGGGVCVFEEDCSAKLAGSPGLFNAQDDIPYAAGIASANPEVSPFTDWTQVYLPYCNQDVFAGGGATEDLGSLQLPRYGSVNLRAAIQMTRDVLWKELDAEAGAGFRPDQVTALIGGWSAGSYGTMYNYHWLLDDLQWPNTAAFPDAGMALDNQEALGVRALGEVKIPAWGTLPNLPPYCFNGDCAVGPILFEALSPRLKQVPTQQILNVTNPKDSIQQNDAYFSDEAFWINTMRQAYCDSKELPGIRFYFTSNSTDSVHVVTIRDEYWLGSVDGVVMKDWFERAISDPDSVQNRVEEANFVQDVPGVEPFPCDVAP